MKKLRPLFLLIGLASLLMLAACLASDDRGHALTMEITEENDSLLHFDSLIVTVHSKDGMFSQEVFHGVLRSPGQVKSMPLDPRVGDNYTITIVGFKDGKIGVNKEVIFIGGESQSKDIPIKTEKPETVVVTSGLPDILAPPDTEISEGDSLRFRISVKNPWTGITTLSLKAPIAGATLDTAGRADGDAYFSWRPSFDQGRAESYSVTFVYASSTQKVEKVTRIKVANVNRPPKLAPIPDQKAKENETLTLRVEASDPDHDTLTLTASGLPTGSTFASGIFTWTPAEGQAGNYTVRFRAFDGADSGLTAVLITVGNVDVPPPLTIKITYPAHDTTINITPITVSYAVNGTPLQKEFPLKDGKNRIRIDTTVQNRAGSDTILITLDTVPPGAPVVSGESPVKTHTPTWTWASGGNGGSGIFRYRLDEMDLTSSKLLPDTAFTPTTDLSPGTHTLFVQERDAAGNWSPTGRFAIVLDVSPPAPPVAAPGFIGLTNNPKPTWKWMSGGGDGMGTFRYRVDNDDLSQGASTGSATNYTPSSNLGEGPHTLYIQERDSAGNWSEVSPLVVRIDLTSPAVPSIDSTPYSPLNTLRPTWTWKGGGGGMGVFRCKVDDGNMNSGSDTIGQASFKPSNDYSEGPHTLYVQERDSAGNWSGTSQRILILSIRKVIGSPGFSPNPIDLYQASLKISPQYGPIVVYNGDFNQSVKMFGSGSWIGISSSNVYGQFHWANSLAISPSGIPFVVLEDSNYRSTVLRYVQPNWELVGFSDFAGGGVGEAMISFTADGVPYIAYRDESNGKATVRKFNGSVWDLVGPRGFTDGFTIFPQLAITKSGSLYFACIGDSLEQDAIAIRRFDGSANSWKSFTKFPVHSYGSWPFHLAVGPDDTLFLALFTKENMAAEVYKLSGDSWSRVGEPASPYQLTRDIGFSISKSGQLFISYSDENNGNRITVKSFKNGSWKSVGPMGFTTQAFGNTIRSSLATDSQGVPYILYSDATNGNRATVMKASFDP